MGNTSEPVGTLTLVKDEASGQILLPPGPGKSTVETTYDLRELNMYCGVTKPAMLHAFGQWTCSTVGLSAFVVWSISWSIRT